MEENARHDAVAVETLGKPIRWAAACDVLSRSAVDLERSRLRFAIALLGESLREIAVLLAVFVPLDAIMQQRAISTARSLQVGGAIIGLFVVGIAVEVGARWTR
jgi:hypothetical protein